MRISIQITLSCTRCLLLLYSHHILPTVLSIAFHIIFSTDFFLLYFEVAEPSFFTLKIFLFQ